MEGQNWRIMMDRIRVNLKNLGPPFFKLVLLNIKMSFTQLENHCYVAVILQMKESCSANLTLRANN